MTEADVPVVDMELRERLDNTPGITEYLDAQSALHAVLGPAAFVYETARMNYDRGNRTIDLFDRVDFDDTEQAADLNRQNSDATDGLVTRRKLAFQEVLDDDSLRPAETVVVSSLLWSITTEAETESFFGDVQLEIDHIREMGKRLEKSDVFHYGHKFGGHERVVSVKDQDSLIVTPSTVDADTGEFAPGSVSIKTKGVLIRNDTKQMPIRGSRHGSTTKGASWAELIPATEMEYKVWGLRWRTRSASMRGDFEQLDMAGADSITGMFLDAEANDYTPDDENMWDVRLELASAATDIPELSELSFEYPLDYKEAYANRVAQHVVDGVISANPADLRKNRSKYLRELRDSGREDGRPIDGDPDPDPEVLVRLNLLRLTKEDIRDAVIRVMDLVPQGKEDKNMVSGLEIGRKAVVWKIYMPLLEDRICDIYGIDDSTWGRDA